MCASLGLAAATACMNFPSTINANTLISQASVNDYNGQIDSTSNIRGDNVYVYQGQADTTVYPRVYIFIALFNANFLKFLTQTVTVFTIF